MPQRLETDWTLFITIVVLVCVGVVMVFSASSVVAEFKYRSSSQFVLHQAGWAFVSFLVLMWIKKTDYRVLHTPAWAFGGLAVVLFLLVVVYFADSRSHRWLRLGVGSLQPSEFAKPALAIFLAYFVARRLAAINNNRYTLAPVGLVLTSLALAVGAADLGTAIVLLATAGTVFYVAGLERRYVFLAFGLMLVFVGFAVVSKGYRLGRVISYVDPEYKILDRIDPNGYVKDYVRRSSSVRDPGYQAKQSKIALGSGGIFGVGLMQSRQKLFYLPEAHTDFIYAVIGEELGFWGTTSILFGFLVILWRGLRLFWFAPDNFGKYLALAVTSSVVFQSFLNMSVVLEMGPTKGIPLPMISYGGSSLLSTLLSLGILLSVSEHSG
jgi:cell division protein FtsW